MTTKKHMLNTFVSAAAISVAWAATASAQDTEDKKSGYALEEITVTARKVEESLQDTPIAISAFTGEGLERRQIFSTDDLDNVTPNLQFSNNAPLAGNNNSSQVFIRGIGQTDPTSTVDPGVGIYIDDVYMGQSVGGTMDFRDIAGVQILRGPQGTLFGRNTIGGAILITTTEPGDELGGTFKAGIGSDRLREVFAAVDIPLGDNIRSRFTFGSRDRDGYVIRVSDGIDLGDTNSYTFTGKFVFSPSDNLEIKAQFDYTKADENGSPLVFAASNEGAIFQKTVSLYAGCPGMLHLGMDVPLVDDDRCANDFWNEGPYANNGTNPLESILENYGGSLHITYDLNDSLTLKSVTSARNLNWSGVRDADNTPFPILHTDYKSDGKQFSQEFQAVYASDKLSGATGLYFSNEEIDDIVRVVLSPPPAPTGVGDSDDNRMDNKNWAAFSQWTYNVSDKLSLTLGGRYTNEEKVSYPDQFSLANPTVKYLPLGPYPMDFSAFNISANASYRWSDNVMTYVSYSEGFKSGGWNSHFNTSFDGNINLPLIHAFDEETAKNYEFGFKLDLADDTLRLNGAVFSTDYKDLQLVYRFGVAPFILNAGKASNDGFELEMTWVPTDRLVIDAGIGYLDGTIDEVVLFADAVTAVEAGNRLPFAPEWQGNVGVGYIFDTNSDFTITPRADLSYQSKTYFDAINTEEVAQGKGRTTINASVALEPSSEQWKLTVGVSNLTDQLYPIAGNSSLGTGSGYAEIAYARPREWFASFSYDF